MLNESLRTKLHLGFERKNGNCGLRREEGLLDGAYNLADGVQEDEVHRKQKVCLGCQRKSWDLGRDLVVTRCKALEEQE